MKLLCFIDQTKIDEFFEKIKNKYIETNPSFFKYFKTNYLTNSQFNDKSWNYYTFYINDKNHDRYFFTNNICESPNRIFNMHFISNRKSFYSFRKCILETLKYVKDKKEYEEKGPQITRALQKFVKEKYNQERLLLITYNEFINIINDYNYNHEENISVIR